MALKIKDKQIPFQGQSVHLGGTALLVILLVVSLVLVIVYSRESDDGALHSIQDSTSALTSPLSSLGTSASSIAASATTSVEDLTASGQTLSQLQESNATLAQMVVELEEYRQEAQRLEALIGLHDAYGFTSVSSRVTNYASDSYNRMITIDAGSASGVVAGMPVMGNTGVIGQISSTNAYSSQVRLLTDAQSGVAVILQNSRAEGIVTGSVDGVLYLEGIDQSVDISEGEAVITSGLGGGYYRGLVIGTVSSIEQRQGDTTRTIVITPNATFDNISEVMVVLSMSNGGAVDNANIIASVGPDALLGSSSDSNENSSSSDENSDENSNNSAADENNSSGE